MRCEVPCGLRSVFERDLDAARERPTRDPPRIKIQTISKEGDLLPRITQVTHRQDLLYIERAIPNHWIRIDRQPSTLREHDIPWP